MKWFFWVSFSLLILGCKQKEELQEEKTIIEKDTLQLPHFPAMDYDAQFKNNKLNATDFYQKRLQVKYFFEDYWAKSQVRGGLLVAKNGKLIYENYRGYANAEKKDTLTAETPIHIASISKVMTALAIMKLVEADKLKLDQLVSHVFPAFPFKNITIKDLLSHRSGLPNYAYFQHDDKYWNTHKTQTNQDVLNALVHKIAIS